MQRKQLRLAGGLALLVSVVVMADTASADRRGGHRGHSIERLLERFDTDKDGKLTQEELDAARKDLLANHDADKDGSLSLKEFESLWIEVMRRRMVRGFQRLDGDGDAAVTLEEFLKPFAHTVEVMDRNGDGVVSRSDRRRHRGHDQGRRHRRSGDRR
ncbi:MAG: EF-hand domain-containing protein [Methyloligellaceae bacterium]